MALTLEAARMGERAVGGGGGDGGGGTEGRQQLQDGVSHCRFCLHHCKQRLETAPTQTLVRRDCRRQPKTNPPHSQ